jgi:peptidyl-prolyl cis-trans isomerase B (cyclophilin B)
MLNTTLGDIKIKLYDSTSVHRDNFIDLVSNGFYDDISFHRVIQDFMIQAGDPSTRTETVTDLPDSLSTYTLPAEFISEYYHKKGALAAARLGNDVNPEMRSSGTQFYIIHGIKHTDAELDQTELLINSNIKQAFFNKFLKEAADSAHKAGDTLSDAEIKEVASLKMFDYLADYEDFSFSDEQREVYKNVGGIPRLDATYTVFGEVVEGMDVVDMIASAETDTNDRPLTDIKIIKAKIVRK